MRRLMAVAVSGLLLLPAQPVRAETTPPAPVWQTCHVTLAGVPVKIRASERTRTIVDGTTPRRAQLSLWVRDSSACGFVQVFSTIAWVGHNGFSNGKTRRQGSLTTPTGTYTMTEAFGIEPDPGTLIPYHQVVEGDWWVQDNKSRYYNSLRNEAQGGFRPSQRGINRSERLLDFGKQYAHAVVINFNRAPDVQIAKRGSGIFLHANSGEGATAGCVSIGKPKLRMLMSYLQPKDRITIVR